MVGKRLNIKLILLENDTALPLLCGSKQLYEDHIIQKQLGSSNGNMFLMYIITRSKHVVSVVHYPSFLASTVHVPIFVLPFHLKFVSMYRDFKNLRQNVVLRTLPVVIPHKPV
jgi:hypothetical protein